MTERQASEFDEKTRLLAVVMAASLPPAVRVLREAMLPMAKALCELQGKVERFQRQRERAERRKTADRERWGWF